MKLSLTLQQGGQKTMKKHVSLKASQKTYAGPSPSFARGFKETGREEGTSGYFSKFPQVSPVQKDVCPVHHW